MLLLALLLVSMALANEGERTIDSFIVKIEDNTLTNVQPTEESSDSLDLSGLGLQGLKTGVFDNLVTLKSLHLTNNSLSSIPKGAFSKVRSLEHLSLASNNFSHFRDAFVGLDRLKTLNISHNPVTKMRYSEYYGVPKSCVILTEGLNLKIINSNAFEPVAQDRYMPDDDEDPRDSLKNLVAYKNACMKRQIKKMEATIKAFVEDGVLKVVENLKENETLKSGWHALKSDQTLSLENLGISKFEKGWYRVDNKSISKLSLAGNEIAEVTPEMLNDLPPGIYDLDLSRNKIERLGRDTIDYDGFSTMNFSSNLISEIEDGALSKVKYLRNLYLTDNRLKDTKCMMSLPPAMELIHLDRNRIVEISPGSSPGHERMAYLYLQDNQIQELKADSLLGLPNLFLLQLANNRISRVERGCFHKTPSLYTIVLDDNDITGFEEGTFDGLDRIGTLLISRNKLTNLKDFILNGLPPNLYSLGCGFSGLETLERGAFKKLPRQGLTLDGNGITRIEEGAFDLPELKTLSLDNNNLKSLDGDVFSNLSDIIRMSFIGNGITRIPKGFTRNFGNLRDLDLGQNPIKVLENGALHGLDRTEPCSIYLDQVPIEKVEAGLFDDV